MGGYARQGPPPDYDFDFVTIERPSNRAVTPEEAPGLFPPFTNPALPLGAVEHRYRIARTEVTTTQWLNFLNAYWPYYAGNPGGVTLTGRWITTTSAVPGQDPGYYIVEGAEHRPTDTSWQLSLTYCNWLHNDKRTDESAFATGAYDMSLLFRRDDGKWSVPSEHLAGARYWLPTLDEWTKAMYYDPDRYGLGVEGYWRYQHGSDTPPVPGFPWDGGETSAGIPFDAFGPYLDVGSYPDARSPWGLLDGSGSATEWTEDSFDGFPTWKGTSQFQQFHDYFDAVDYIGGSNPVLGGVGIRIASTIPSPPTALLLVLAVSYRRRR